MNAPMVNWEDREAGGVLTAAQLAKRASDVSKVFVHTQFRTGQRITRESRTQSREAHAAKDSPTA